MPRKNGSTAAPAEPKAAEIGQLIEDLKAVARDGEELLRSGLGTARERARSGMKTTHRAVRQYPYPSLGIAFGAGLLLGVLCKSLLPGGSDQEEEDDYGYDDE